MMKSLFLCLVNFYMAAFLLKKKSRKETHTSQFKEINNYKYIFLLKNKKADLQTEKLEVFGKLVQVSLRQLMAGKSTPTVSQE